MILHPATFNYAQTLTTIVRIVILSWQEGPAGKWTLELQVSINKDQVEGRIDEAKGAIKEVAGKIVGNPSLELRGNVEKNLGKVQAKVGEIREELTKPIK